MDPALLAGLRSWALPILITLAVTALIYWLIGKSFADRNSNRLYRQLAYVALVVFAMITSVLVLPFDVQTRGQLLSLFGLVLTAIIALSSTTFVSNAMAGLALKAMGSFHTGDFIRVATHFGRVTAKGLLHTELQSEDRDIIVLPNLYLMTNPVQVVDQSGTLISAELSIGYDVHRRKIRDLLLAAAESAELTEPFVQIIAIGNFAVEYKVTGFLEDVSMLVSKRSELKARVLDTLHQNQIEVMTPSVMSQRPMAPDVPVLPTPEATPDHHESGNAERIMFDKAELAARIERFRQQRDTLKEEIATLQQENKDGNALEIAWREHQVQSLETFIARYENDGS
jgi:small-conductance mechanosensitive channel